MAAAIPKHHKIVIIGAGLAGLGAAQRLKDARIENFVILEAQSKIGGRVSTTWQTVEGNDDQGYPIELGATFIHGIQGNPIFALAKKHKLLIPSPKRATRKEGSRTSTISQEKVLNLSENGNTVPQDAIWEIFQEVNFIFEEAGKMHESDDDDISGLMCVPLCIPKKQDVGLRSYVEQRVRASWHHCTADEIKLRNSILSHRLMSETTLSGCHDMNEVSSKQFGTYEELGGSHVVFPNGYQTVCDVLAEDISQENKLLLNHPVKCVYWNCKESSNANLSNLLSDSNQTDEQKTPLLSPTDDIEISITDEIALKCLNSEAASFNESASDSIRHQTTSIASTSLTDHGRFRKSHSNQDLQKDSKLKDLPLKTCVVECENGQAFIADHVIVTVSLGCLKESHETMFNPTLPIEKRYAIKKMGIGTVDKIFLKFDNLDFMPENIESLRLFWNADVTGSSEKWWRKISRIIVHNSPDRVWLMIWLTGHEAEFAERLSDKEVSVGVTGVLKTFLKRDDIPLPTEVLRSRWFENRFTRGSYSYIAVGSTVDDLDVLAQPLFYHDNTAAVLFAGEATHPSFYSTAHGALLSGAREADKIIELYQ